MRRKIRAEFERGGHYVSVVVLAVVGAFGLHLIDGLLGDSGVGGLLMIALIITTPAMALFLIHGLDWD